MIWEIGMYEKTQYIDVLYRKLKKAGNENKTVYIDELVV